MITRRTPTRWPFIVSLIAGFSIILNIVIGANVWNRSIVVAVPDGDTLQLADGRRVRLRSIDAPEKDRCMAHEARTLLESTVLHTHIRLKDTLTDSYGRILAVAFMGNKNLNAMMLEKGLARHFSSGTNYDNLLGSVSNNAKNLKLGVFSEVCKSSTPKNNCVIKGNLRSGIQTYYLPSCDAYDQVIVDESYGDQWFCSEQEATGAGFLKAIQCPSN